MFDGYTTWTEHYGYNPDPMIPKKYSGIYPVSCLQKARTSLINSLKYDTSDILEQVKPKIGIGSSYGPPLAPPTPPAPPGLLRQNAIPTPASSTVSHSQLGTSTKGEESTPVRRPSVASSSSSEASTTRPSTSTGEGTTNALKIQDDKPTSNFIKQSATGGIQRVVSASTSQQQGVTAKMIKTDMLTMPYELQNYSIYNAEMSMSPPLQRTVNSLAVGQIIGSTSVSPFSQPQILPSSVQGMVKSGLLLTSGQSQNALSSASATMVSSQPANARSLTPSERMVKSISLSISDQSSNAPGSSMVKASSLSTLTEPQNVQSSASRSVKHSLLSSNLQNTHSASTISRVAPNTVNGSSSLMFETPVNTHQAYEFDSVESRHLTSFTNERKSKPNIRTHQLANIVSIPLTDFDHEQQSETSRDGNGLWHMKRKLDMENSDDGTPEKKIKGEATSTGGLMQQLYKCDFCSYRGSTPVGMEFHLNQAKHFSASLYNARGSEIVSVERKLAVKNKFGKNQALAVVCPECKDLFEDIFMCAVHYRVIHGYDSTNGCYSVCPVIHQEIVFINVASICRTCSESFINHRQLNKHWQKSVDHHPVQKPLPKDKAFALYTCVYCNMGFLAFLNCKAHVINHKSDGPPGQICTVKVQYIMLPQRTEEIPPYSERSTKEFYRDELTTLRSMKNHFHGMYGTKAKIKLVEKRIRYLTQFFHTQCDSAKPHSQTWYEFL